MRGPSRSESTAKGLTTVVRRSVHCGSTGDRRSGLGADLRVGIVGGDVSELVEVLSGQRAGPVGFAGDATEGVGRLASDSWHRVLEDRGDGSDRSAVGDVVEDLDAPPADSRM